MVPLRIAIPFRFTAEIPFGVIVAATAPLSSLKPFKSIDTSSALIVIALPVVSVAAVVRWLDRQ
jgi:hypothetical protein